MRFAAFLFVLCLSACAATVPKPSPNCEGIELCQQSSKAKIYTTALGPEHTVQLMLQEPMLINGKPADPSEWPASVYARAGSSACSATLVGDRVLFMASHCMNNGGQVSFTAHANNYTARCTHHPEYRNNATADWALCIVDRPVTGVNFENMGVSKVVLMNDTMMLSGYGCIKPGGGGGNDGIFRVGTATVRGLPHEKTYDIVTKGGAALCFGDSGGSAYSIKADGSRYVMAVNSRGDISSMSYLPAVYSPSFKTWAEAWAKASNNVRICGLHADALGCRTGEAIPQPDGKFEINSKVACIKGLVAPQYLPQKDTIVETVRRSLDIF